MSSDNADLLRYASEYAEKSIDLYEVLGIDALTPKKEIHRAWRKASLQYHPDKAGDAFDAGKWELFERARDVLMDGGARAAYDGAIKAQLLRKQEREAFDKERRRFADDLEAREGAHRAQQEDKLARDREALDKERARLAEAQRLREDEKRRQAEAEQDFHDLAEARRRLKDKKDEKARRKQARMSMKAAGRPSGPLNGVVNVPGEYLADLGAVKKPYWELVCDKLKAVQAARNLAKEEADSEVARRAEEGVQEARRRIAEAEAKFSQETTAA